VDLLWLGLGLFNVSFEEKGIDTRFANPVGLTLEPVHESDSSLSQFSAALSDH
jgi:hypothetical protein